MKIICKKGHNAQKMLQMVTNLIEKKSREYPLLSEDMEIEITLDNEEGQVSPDNDRQYYFDEEVQSIEMMQENAAFYYSKLSPVKKLFRKRHHGNRAGAPYRKILHRPDEWQCLRRE